MMAAKGGDKARKDEIIRLTEELLAAITSGDYDEYSKTCADYMTAFVPETCGHIMKGKAFHKACVLNEKAMKYKAIDTTILNPRVHLMGDDVACIAYLRLTQFVDSEGVPRTTMFEETRVWQRLGMTWKAIHCHRSGPGREREPKKVAAATS